MEETQRGLEARNRDYQEVAGRQEGVI